MCIIAYADVKLASPFGTNFFKAKGCYWYSSYFGNDNQSLWREKPAVVRIEFDEKGKISGAKKTATACSIELPDVKECDAIEAL